LSNIEIEEYVKLVDYIKELSDSVKQRFEENVLQIFRESSQKKDEVIKLYRDMLNDKHIFENSLEKKYAEMYRDDFHKINYKYRLQEINIKKLQEENCELKLSLKDIKKAYKKDAVGKIKKSKKLDETKECEKTSTSD